MNAFKPKSCRALTSLDVLVLVATAALGLIVLMALPLGVPSGAAARAKRISCVNNLRQLGIASRLWANDHGERWVWQVPTSATGSLEIATSGDLAAILRPMSNELNSPKILHCPSDERGTIAADFAALRNKDISYFIGLDADETQPQTILAGDRNITGGVMLSNGVMLVSSSSNLVVGTDMHHGALNIALGDGSSQQINTAALQRQVLCQQQSASNQIVRWAFP